MDPYIHQEIERELKPVLLEGLQKVQAWRSAGGPGYLRSIFDQLGFMDKDGQAEAFYVPPHVLSSISAYPLKANESALEQMKTRFVRETGGHPYQGLSDEYLRGFSSANQLLFLLEKLGGSIPCEEDNAVSLYDACKVKAATRLIRLNRERPDCPHEPGLLLINIDVSGIQNFIYGITSQNALKNLRARSFFVELLCSHAVNRVLRGFSLHHVNVLLNGGGNITILSSKPAGHADILEGIDHGLNAWLFKELRASLAVVFTAVEADDRELSSGVSGLLKRLSAAAFVGKNRRFDSLIRRGEFSFIDEAEPGSARCAICRKDFTPQADMPAGDLEETGVCPFCERLTRLGRLIPNARYIHIAEHPESIRIEDTFYRISATKLPDPCAWVIYEHRHDLVKDLEGFCAPMFAGAYTVATRNLPEGAKERIEETRRRIDAVRRQETDATVLRALDEEEKSLAEDHPATLEHLAYGARGAEYIGALKMDADNMGKILQQGFRGGATLERLSALSRSLNYFFKLHLSSICGKGRGRESQKIVQVIYAGGDDLFALGAWNDIADLAIAVGDRFKEYTCGNPDFGLSGGFTLHKPKFPVSKMAELASGALAHAKANLDPCWFCRQEWRACPLLRHGKCLRKDSLAPFFTEAKAARKAQLDKKFIRRYSTDPSRLKIAFKRQRFTAGRNKPVDEVRTHIQKPLKVFTCEGFAERPRNAFFRAVSALLDVWYEQGMLYLPKIAWLIEKQKKNLRRMKDEAADVTLYDLYDWNLHVVMSTEMLSALHVPLSWVALLFRERKETDAS